MHLFVILACQTGSITLDDTAAPADADTDTDTDADADADTDTDTDTDTDADTDTEPVYAGDYEGWMNGLYGGGWDEYDCEGEVYFSADQDGVFTGNATCDLGGDYSYEGEIDGEIEADGTVTGTWLLDFGGGWDPWEVALEGEWNEGVVILDFYEDFGRGGTLEGTMEAELQ